MRHRPSATHVAQSADLSVSIIMKKQPVSKFIDVLVFSHIIHKIRLYWPEAPICGHHLKCDVFPSRFLGHLCNLEVEEDKALRVMSS